MTKPECALGSDDTEIVRLQTQAAFIAEPTTLLLQRGGIRPGMRVLDLGSGPGDVAFQVAEMVGPGGSVVGVEQDPAQIAVAMQRRDGLGFRNVDFRLGDARTFLDEEPFDAVVCRLRIRTRRRVRRDAFPLLFKQAGFRDVGTLGLQAYWPPRSSHAAAYLVGVARAMKDAMVNSGVATEEEIGLDTLEQRLGEAFMSANAVFSLPTVVGGWGRRPQ